MIDIERHLSRGARAFQESAIRRAGILGAAVPGLISLSAGNPAPEMFPWDELSAIAAEVLGRRDGFALQYGATRGYRPLVEHLAGSWLAARGIAARPDEVIVTTGSQQGLDLAGRVLIDPGDVVFVELPTYSGAIAAFRNQQATLAGVPRDEEGIDPDALERAVAAARASGRRAAFVYVTPNFQNPTGLLMSAARRRALLDVAARLDLVILEDDPYGTLYFDGATGAADTRPLKADDAEGRVVYLGSASKTLVPGLRVAWLVAAAPLVKRAELAKQAADLCSGVFDQRLVHAAFDRGVAARLAPLLRGHYQAKRDRMEQALRTHLATRVAWRSPHGGFFIWVTLPEGVDDEGLFERALARRVSFVAGSAFFVDGSGHQYARLSYSGITEAQIAEGIERLAAAIGDCG